MTKRVAILGSGVCGLAIAIRLREIDPALHITLFESEDRIGGLARSLTLGGQAADMGPHRIHTELPDVQAFLNDLAGPDLVRVERRSRMWLEGRWIEYPPRPAEILRVLGPWRVARVMASFGAGVLGRATGRRDEQENFETVMRAAFGGELYRLIVLRYTRKVWKTDPRNLHADIARVRVSAGGLDRLVKRVVAGEKPGQETALRRFYYIPGGVEKLVAKMHARLGDTAGIRLRHRVTDLEPREQGGWRVVTQSPDGTREEDFDLVFSTIPVTDLVDMLERRCEDPAAAAARRDMHFIANFLVCVLARRDRITDSQWLYFPGADTIFNRGYEPRNFDAGMGPAGSSLLVLETTCRHGDRIWRARDESLVEHTLRGLERTGLLARAEVENTLVHRIPHTYPIYDTGYRERLGHVWKYLGRFAGLLSVGRQGLFLHNNMDHSMHMGFRAADCALREHPGQAERHFYAEVGRFQQFRIVD